MLLQAASRGSIVRAHGRRARRHRAAVRIQSCAHGAVVRQRLKPLRSLGGSRQPSAVAYLKPLYGAHDFVVDFGAHERGTWDAKRQECCNLTLSRLAALCGASIKKPANAKQRRALAREAAASSGYCLHLDGRMYTGLTEADVAVLMRERGISNNTIFGPNGTDSDEDLTEDNVACTHRRDRKAGGQHGGQA